MSSVDVLLGLQWGDEGKGKVVDILSPRYDIIARFQGGPNAGHTLEIDGKRYVLHQIPSGIFRAKGSNVIGNGVALDPVILRKEIEGLENAGVAVRQSLCISKKASLILPTHRLLDHVYEEQKGADKIGSTLKGIGPSYQDKVGRQGLRVGDVCLPGFTEKMDKLAEAHLEKLRGNGIAYSWDELRAEFLQAIDFIARFPLIDSEYFFNDQLEAGANILAEGAQGALLDIDFGSYPFVTSSNTVAAGACTGLGVAPTRIREIFGLFKAYSTRVGSGPFPTELIDEEGEQMRQIGREFGSTTGRPRRCGWIDLPALRYAIMLNGVSQLFMMKADVLNTFSRIKVCTHYRLDNGDLTDRVPHNWVRQKVEPVYVELPGWNCQLTQDHAAAMPPAMQGYISFLQQRLKTPISLVSIGPDRLQTLFLKPLLDIR